MQGHLASVGVVIHTPRDAPMVVAGPWKGVVIRVVTPTPGDNHKRFILHRHHAPCMTARPGAVSGHYGDLYSLPIHLGGFRGSGVCIVVPAKQGRSQDTARHVHGMRKKMVIGLSFMVVLPMLARRTGTRYRESLK